MAFNITVKAVILNQNRSVLLLDGLKNYSIIIRFDRMKNYLYNWTLFPVTYIIFLLLIISNIICPLIKIIHFYIVNSVLFIILISGGRIQIILTVPFTWQSWKKHRLLINALRKSNLYISNRYIYSFLMQSLIRLRIFIMRRLFIRHMPIYLNTY